MRHTYPEAERKHKWLSNLLDAYHIADEGVKATLEHYAATGRPIACSAGCAACCKSPCIPLTQPEMQGISWYVTEVLEGEVRPVVKARLENHATAKECPFLVQNKCTVYPVRPLICRQFMVRNRACEATERVDESRPEDIVMPPRTSIQKVAIQLMNFWSFPNRKAKMDAFERGFIGTKAKGMHLYDWREMATLMDAFDARK